MKLIDDLRRENLISLREEFGGASSFSEKIGKSESQISQWINGSTHSATGKPRGMRSSSARFVEQKCGKPVGWLDQDHGQQNQDGSAAPEHVFPRGHPDFMEVQQVKLKLSAGVSGFVIEHEDGNGKPVFFHKDWFDLRGYTPAKMFAARVNGASMEPSLWDGDLVVINTADVRPHDGDVYALNYEGEMCIKRLRRDAGEWWATSDNADQRRFSPKRCTEDVIIIGRVVHRQGERI